MATSTKLTSKKPTLRELNEGLRLELDAVQNDHERLSEALGNAVMMLRADDIGWAKGVDTGADYLGLQLPEIKKWSNDIRASITGSEDGLKAPNPHMRNGLMLRHSFIWDGDMHYEGIPASSQGRRNVDDLINSGENNRLVFSPPARRRREHALYADGMYVLVGDNRTKRLRPVPLHEITETQRSDLYEDEIIAYRWTRNEVQRERGKVIGDGQRKAVSHWVFVDWYEGPVPTAINYNGKDEKVLKSHTAFDMHANRPDGQAFGSPDAIAAVVWARIVRDLIMNGVKMQDALAMFAFKATAKGKSGQQSQALELGNPQEAGSTATMAGDADLVPFNSAGKGYDFSSIGFVVSTMAASLHVPGIALSANTALAGSSYGAAKTLDLPNRMAMQTRRQEHVEFDRRLLVWLGAKDAKPFFNNYDDSTDEYRAIQGAYIAFQSGTLTAEGFRNELEIIYGRKILGPIPKGVLIPNNEKSLARKDIDTDSEGGGPTPTSAPSPLQGKSDGSGGAGHANDLPKPEEK